MKKMKLVTADIKKKFAKYPLHSQDGKKGDAMCIATYFFPMGAWTWYVLEGNADTGEIFCVCINGYGEGEYGYNTIQQLSDLCVHGLSVERDKVFKPKPLKEIYDAYLQEFLAKFTD